MWLKIYLKTLVVRIYLSIAPKPSSLPGHPQNTAPSLSESHKTPIALLQTPIHNTIHPPLLFLHTYQFQLASLTLLYCFENVCQCSVSPTPEGSLHLQHTLRYPPEALGHLMHTLAVRREVILGPRCEVNFVATERRRKLQ